MDGINDTQEIVVKPLGKQLKGLTVYAGATIMGDGRVALILDVLGIGQRSGVLAESREQTRGGGGAEGADRRSSGSACCCSGPALSSASRFRCRWWRGSKSSRFRHRACRRRARWSSTANRILPLVPLATVLEPRLAGARARSPDPVQVIVFNDGDRSVGVVVDQILDVAEEAVTVRQKSGPQRPTGSAVVGKRVTDFLDLNDVIRRCRRGLVSGQRRAGSGKTILVAEASAFSRGLIRSGLDMAGYGCWKPRIWRSDSRAGAATGGRGGQRRWIFRPTAAPALLAAMRKRPSGTDPGVGAG